MAWKVTTEPDAEPAPISLTEAKLHLRVTSSADDELITALIRAAREWCELFQNRAFVTQTITLTLDRFPNVFEIPKPPLQSVSSIKYIDTAGVQQTLDPSVYDVDTVSEPGRIALAYGQSWPSIRGDINSVEVIYVAGYATKFVTTFASDLLTVSGRVYTDGDIVRLVTTDGDLPAPLETYTDYHVRDVSGYTLKLAATVGGAAITLTDDGTGTHFIGFVPFRVISAMKLLIGHWYEHREAVSALACKEVPMAVKSLLSMDRVF